MPIKCLDGYLAERKHLQTHSLSVLSDTRLGIDASHYIRLLLETPPTREPLLAATGGPPLALVTRLENDLRVLEKYRIKPVFVFPGLPTNNIKKKYGGGPAALAQMPPALQHEQQEACRDRREAWMKYENNQEEAATRLFEGRGNVAQWDVWRIILRIFRHRNVEFMVAPYISWAQLIYLQRHPKAYVHAIYGSTETLLYPGVDKLITSVDFASPQPTFTFISKRSILQDLQLSEEQFLEAGIMLSCDHSPNPFPPVAHDHTIRSTVEMVKHYKSGLATVAAFGDQPPVKMIGYPEQFARARCLVKYSLILAVDGTVQPLPLATASFPSSTSSPALGNHHYHPPTATDIPTDLHEIFTNRLPDEIYYYMSRGLISPQSLSWLTSGQIIEAPPLDNGETTEYKRFVKEVITDGQTGPRATALALISGTLVSFWTNKKVYGCFWFDQHGMMNGHGANGAGGMPSSDRSVGPGGPQGNGGGSVVPKPISHNAQQTVVLADRVGQWSVPYAVVEDELRRQNSSTIDFALCLGATSTEKLSARTRARRDKPGAAASGTTNSATTGTGTGTSNLALDKKDEVVANVIWRFLELRGFLLNTHTHGSLARAMHNAIKHARVNDKFQEPLYLFLELVRAGVMHGHLWSSRAFSGGPSFGTDDEKQCMLLVMRVLSIVPLTFKAQPWSAPLSRELLVFNSFVKSLTRALRTLLEVASLNMLLRGEARRGREDLLDIALSLPFQMDVNTGFGVLAKVYLDALTHINNRTRVRDANAEGVKEAKALALEICEDTFPGVKNPKAEVERGFRFWDCALMAMRQLAKEGAVLNELTEQFEAAEAWLAPMRP